MAISKVVYKSSPNATPEVWMDATTATAAAADITAPKTAMLADGVVTTGTGSGGGGGTVAPSDVNFYDYDGTLVASKTKAEINAMTSDSDLPANPSHTGLTAQGWNWTVTQLKAQLLAMPDQPVAVGQMYVTQSGATEIDVVFPDAARLDPILTIAVNGTITVDWGDDTTPDTVTGTSLTTRQAVSHNYASTGNYMISISAVTGSYAFYGSTSYLLLRKNTTTNENRVYANRVHAVRIGTGVESIGQYAFCYCQSLASITIPSSVTSIASSAFNYCYSLASITIPSNVTSIGTSLFYYCTSLASITIPSNVTSISNSAFNSCYSLASITIPSNITSIGTSVFGYCYSLANITIPSNVTSVGNNSFDSCYSLASITIPSSVTSIGNSAFNYCYSLASITIPSNVTSIGNTTFQNCYSLASITIPSGVTSIGNNAFSSCYGVAEYHVMPTTPPTLGTTAFSNIVSDCIIYVPYSADHSVLNAYKTETNWSTYASRMQEEPQ